MFKTPFFNIEQNDHVFKFGTDSMLLGSWTNVYGVRNVLDVGAGTGVLSLMLASRNSNLIATSIDINKEAILLASKNFSDSVYHDRLQAFHTSLADFNYQNPFDYIICNPPFFKNSTKGKSKYLDLARHQIEFDLKKIPIRLIKMLDKEGIFGIVVPLDLGLELIDYYEETYQLFNIRKCIVKPSASKKPNRLLLEFGLKQRSTKVEQLVIYDSLNPKIYSKAYLDLCGQFYL